MRIFKRFFTKAEPKKTDLKARLDDAARDLCNGDAAVLVVHLKDGLLSYTLASARKPDEPATDNEKKLIDSLLAIREATRHNVSLTSWVNNPPRVGTPTVHI